MSNFTVYAVQRTMKSQPVAHFSSYEKAKAYNLKWYDGAYEIVSIHVTGD